MAERIFSPDRDDCYETYHDLQEVNKVIAYFETGEEQDLNGIGARILDLFKIHPALMLLPKNAAVVLLLQEAESISNRLREQLSQRLIH